MGWVNFRKLNSDYFTIKKRNKGEDLDYYLDKIDLDNYWIYKATRLFRRVEVDDIGNHYCYIFFEKDLYCKDHFDKWIEGIKKIDNIKIYFLDKPFPRVEILKKLEVV